MKRLSDEGHPGVSARLNDAIIGGATGTEILMATRWELRKFKKSRPKISRGLAAGISDLISKLNRALGCS